MLAQGNLRVVKGVVVHNRSLKVHETVYKKSHSMNFCPNLFPADPYNHIKPLFGFQDLLREISLFLVAGIPIQIKIRE
jgi:hypothetical protein